MTEPATPPAPTPAQRNERGADRPRRPRRARRPHRPRAPRRRRLPPLGGSDATGQGRLLHLADRALRDRRERPRLGRLRHHVVGRLPRGRSRLPPLRGPSRHGARPRHRDPARASRVHRDRPRGRRPRLPRRRRLRHRRGLRRRPVPGRLPAGRRDPGAGSAGRPGLLGRVRLGLGQAGDRVADREGDLGHRRHERRRVGGRLGRPRPGGEGVVHPLAGDRPARRGRPAAPGRGADDGVRAARPRAAAGGGPGRRARRPPAVGDEAGEAPYPVEVEGTMDAEAQPLPPARQVAPDPAARARAGRPLDRLLRPDRRRRRGDPLHGALPAGDLRLQRRRAPLDVARRLLRVRRARHRPLPALRARAAWTTRRRSRSRTRRGSRAGSSS